LLLTLAVACVLAGCADIAWSPRTRDDGERRETAPKPKDDDVVCPGIILKVGPAVELPCAPGAKILEATSVKLEGRYCARVTYVAETGSPPRKETLCPGDVPSVGGTLTGR
jgi:hypothetical protein